MKGAKAFALAGLVLGGAIVASAKEAEKPQLLPNPLQGLTLQAGLFYPQTQNAKNFEGGRWFYAGLGWDTTPHLSLFGIGANTEFDLDYITKGSFTSVPITLNARVSAGRVFVGAGAGVAFVHRIDETATSFSETTFGYKVFGGFNVVDGPFPVFVQGTYFGNSRQDLSGWALSVGVRF